MIQNKFGQQIFSQQDLSDMVMSGRDLTMMHEILVDGSVQMAPLEQVLDQLPKLLPCSGQDAMTVTEFDRLQQANWLMPDQYKNMDIAQYILNLCTDQAELQRVGQELLLFQEHGLFDLLRYLHYLVTIMQENHIIYGVGRGSSVASYVLYKLGVHRVNSLFYDLDIKEFLR